MTTTISRTEAPDAPRRHWQAPRRPVAIAIVVVAAVTAALWGIHWWGPLNPGVEVRLTEAQDFWSTVTLDVRNTSRSPLTIESVALTRLGSTDTATTVVTPVEVGPQSAAAVTVDLPSCRNGGSPTMEVELGVRNAVGLAAVLHDVIHANSCAVESFPTPPTPATVVLPPPGVQPDDVPAARTGVTQAYWTVYDGSRPAVDRVALIDDPSGIIVSYAEAPRAMNDATLTDLRSDVRAITFDAPDHAWVDYGLAFGVVGLDSQIGEAVLVDGTWKVTRATVCRDLLLVNVTCSS